MDRPLPPELELAPETSRRAHLISRFGHLGTFFGLGYAAFYLLVGHIWGMGIVLICTAGVFITPAIMRKNKSIELAGNFFSLTLVLGFLGLSFVEGGVHGHAIAWLVSVPLCALLLLGQEAAIQWVFISFLAASLIVGLDLAGINLPTTYDARWNSLISAAGYLGLVVFMFILGLIFENGRLQAQVRMTEALQELAASNERLTYLNNEKSEFLSIAAHDLRTPLSVILGNAEMLNLLKEHDETEKLTSMIFESVERMRRLIDNLLDVNTIEEGKFASQIESCDIASMLRQSAEQYLVSAERKQIALEISASPGVYANADYDATAQILDNLVSNAVKYSPSQTTIRIHSRAEGKSAVISVRDEGPGISEEDQKKMFQKFSRLSAQPTGGESSTGLGLAIVKRLAEAMSGSVTCESTLGSGTTFTLRLPHIKGRAPVKMAANATATAKLRWEALRPKGAHTSRLTSPTAAPILPLASENLS